MKSHLVSWTLLCLALSAIPLSAQVLYEDGPLNGTTDAWTINFGYIVSNTFTLTGAGTVNGFDFYTWTFPGDQLLTVDWYFTSEEFGGTTYGQGTAGVTSTFISNNQYGYSIEKQSVSGLNVALDPGTYWMNLANANTTQGNPVYWDENSGIGCHSPGCPSEVSENTEGTIPPESFDVTGTYGSGGTVPEPGSIVLFGSGIVAVATMLRRRR